MRAEAWVDHLDDEAWIDWGAQSCRKILRILFVVYASKA
jgi:hypothetical protein